MYDQFISNYFAQGKAAMDIMGSFAIGTIRSYNPQAVISEYSCIRPTDNPEDNYMTYPRMTHG